MTRLRFLLTQAGYDLQASMLVVPAVITALMGAAALSLAHLEATWQIQIDLLALEPGTAQATLATLAGSMMTVISVVYSVLLVALSLASVQFSTRILAGLVRDRVSQAVLGLFLGTFVWQLVALRSVHLDPPYAPPLTIAGALSLVVASLGALVVFIDRVIHNIQANHLVNRIADEAESVIDDVFPAKGEGVARDTEWEPVPEGHAVVRADRSGYVQLISVAEASRVAAGRQVELLRPMGSFVPEGAPLWAVFPPDRCDESVRRGLLGAVDLGPIRTMQEDAEWGLRQIVDIGLKAISPAVNDPSTGATCIDHLSRLLIRAGRRGAPQSSWALADGRLVVPGPRYSDLVDLAFDQLRQYGRSDLAIGLRLLKAIADVAEAIDHPEGRARLLIHARDIERSMKAAFPHEDLSEVERRMRRVERWTLR